jgi:hypothetical protein
MKPFVGGLLAIITLGSGDLTGSANELLPTNVLDRLYKLMQPLQIAQTVVNLGSRAKLFLSGIE